ncbi:hypothetical protein [Sphingomonas sp. GB1N7]|uniref:hypothetical protein n=1 Tax=Parasphingomonas caseinilytica TaxID=3096158 RepID=UPI002FCA037E
MRSYDPSALNTLANHPDTVRWLLWNPADHPETEGFLLLDNLFEDERFIILHNGDRDLTMEDVMAGAPLPSLALIFEWSAPGVFEVHTMSHPHARGGNLVDEMKGLLHEMFTEWDADLIWGQVSADNPRALKFFPKIGGVSCGIGHHHVAGDVEYFRNSRARWLADHWIKNIS